MEPVQYIPRQQLALGLEALYRCRNRREYVNPDPLQCVYRYRQPCDREIAGLIAAGLAYGRVAQIMRNVDAVFDEFGPSPRLWVERHNPASMRRTFAGFQHRWTTGEELAAVLVGIRRLVDKYGSLESAFRCCQSPSDADTTPALTGFCDALLAGTRNSLLADPAKNGACKRLHLYLRWMVRADEVDLGCWPTIDPKLLIVPLDTHMHRIARRLRLTARRQANLPTALEVTRAFRRLNPEDPTKYDFVLTRFGIRADLSLQHLDAELHALSG